MTQTHLEQATGVEPNTIRGNRKPACKSAVFLCSEAKAEINAGMIIVTNCRLQQPHLAIASAATMARGLLGSRQAYVRSSHPSLPNVYQLASSGLFWTPMATAIATLPVHWTHAWALLGEWANHITFPMERLFGHDMDLRTFWVSLTFFFLRLPIGQYGPVSQLSRSEERCTGPFNWGEAHCAGEKVKRK